MRFAEILTEKKIAIEEKWFDTIMSSYPEDSVRFFKKQKDQFANPLGHSARQALAKIINQLCDDRELTVPTELEQFVKLRAVQTFTPSQAVSFVYELKGIVIELCGADTLAAVAAEWLQFERKIDLLALRIFDMFMANRERIYQIKLKEFTSGNHIAAGARCPSAAMKNNKEEKIELKVIRDC